MEAARRADQMQADYFRRELVEQLHAIDEAMVGHRQETRTLLTRQRSTTSTSDPTRHPGQTLPNAAD